NSQVIREEEFRQKEFREERLGQKERRKNKEGEERMKISAALIVKNEEACLGRCLSSIAGAVDEIDVVDTGSEDRTKEVARRYTDRIFDYAWRNDFAAARNYSFAQVTGDWVFWVDADDVVIGSENIRPMLERADSEWACFY